MFIAAVARAELYLAAGADLLFIEAPQNEQQMQEIGARFGTRVPLVHNLVEGGNSPVPGSDELIALNYAGEKKKLTQRGVDRTQAQCIQTELNREIQDA